MNEFFEMQSEYIECDCRMELIQLTYEGPEDGNNFDYLYLSLYELGSHRDCRFSWKDRFRHIWYIIRYGTPWKDQITLSSIERKKLTAYLNSIENRKTE